LLESISEKYFLKNNFYIFKMFLKIIFKKYILEHKFISVLECRLKVIRCSKFCQK